MSSKAVTAKLKVAELFAGVGGFRLGLEAISGRPFEIVFSDQYEPARSIQQASRIYRSRWTTGPHINEDISSVLASESGRRAIREASPDIVVGGFPCQDYSVAQPLSRSRGIEGKKGDLWWAIAEFLRQRIADCEPVKYLILENVDRLISSPAICRGRDFAMVLATLNSFGYMAEWRVINAADYGFLQKRRRIFIVAYHISTAFAERVSYSVDEDGSVWFGKLILNQACPADLEKCANVGASTLSVYDDPFTEQFEYRPLSSGKSRFASAGLMVGGKVWTGKAKAGAIDDFTAFTGSVRALTLGEVVKKTGAVPEKFYVQAKDHEKWLSAKSAKCVARVKSGFQYEYAEGAMMFPDPLDRPARTIITSEGGATPSRTKHAVRDASGCIRRLTPEELEGITASHADSLTVLVLLT
jgi:DNA (cytosine-5)-methyltransferase 1